jgi:hypothetical protein
MTTKSKKMQFAPKKGGSTTNTPKVKKDAKAKKARADRG